MSKKQIYEWMIILFGMLVIPTIGHAIPVREITDLTSITFWERTGGTTPDAYTFAVNSTQLTTRLADPLGIGNYDFYGVYGREYYDVYYSNADGTFNLNGEYVSITGVYNLGLPWGGGLNLAEMGLNFIDGSTEYANYIASFVALGDNAHPETVVNAIDGDLLTHTSMGNTVGQTERLRITLGFRSTSVPEPAPLLLFGIGLGLMSLRKRRLV